MTMLYFFQNNQHYKGFLQIHSNGGIGNGQALLAKCKGSVTPSHLFSLSTSKKATIGMVSRAFDPTNFTNLGSAVQAQWKWVNEDPLTARNCPLDDESIVFDENRMRQVLTNRSKTTRPPRVIFNSDKTKAPDNMLASNCVFVRWTDISSGAAEPTGNPFNDECKPAAKSSVLSVSDQGKHKSVNQDERKPAAKPFVASASDSQDERKPAAKPFVASASDSQDERKTGMVSFSAAFKPDSSAASKLNYRKKLLSQIDCGAMSMEVLENYNPNTASIQMLESLPKKIVLSASDEEQKPSVIDLSEPAAEPSVIDLSQPAAEPLVIDLSEPAAEPFVIDLSTSDDERTLAQKWRSVGLNYGSETPK